MTYFTSVPQSERQNCFPPSLYLYPYLHYFMFYRNPVIQILGYWGLSKLHMCGDSILANNSLANLDFQVPEFTFRVFIPSSILHSPPTFPHSFLLCSFLPLEMISFVSYLKLENSKYISRNKFHKCLFLGFYS